MGGRGEVKEETRADREERKCTDERLTGIGEVRKGKREGKVRG
jgi:hypothetical protein